LAKKRVYELARDLNVTNKILLDKMKRTEINVKSHMSALDDETVNKLKQAHILHGDIIPESRVKPTVIRRRKKTLSKPQNLGDNIAPINNSQPEKLIKTSERIERFRKKYEKFQTKNRSGQSSGNQKKLTDLSKELKIPTVELRDQTKEPELDDRISKEGLSDKNVDSKREFDPIKGKTFVIDGLNVCRDFFHKNDKISLKPLITILTEIIERNGKFICIFDANAVYVFKEQRNYETKFLKELLKLDEYFCISTGRSPADDHILNRANFTRESIISNDKYDRYIKKYPWIKKEEERLIKGRVIEKYVSIPDLDIYLPLCANLKVTVKDLIVRLS